MKEQDILEGVAKGERAALKYLYQANFQNVSNYVVKNSGYHDDAHDILQEAIIVVYEKLKNGDLTLSTSLNGFIFAICKKMWLKRLRKYNKVVKGGDLESFERESIEDILDDIENNDREALYRNCFLKLEESCKKILSLFFEGISMKKIADKLNTSEGYARKKKHKCKSKLTEMIKSDPHFDELKYD